MSEENKIRFVKGDSYRCKAKISMTNGKEYVIKDTDKIYLTVKSYRDMPPAITLNLNNGLLVVDNYIDIEFKPTDTQNMDVGFIYRYDLEVVTANNDVYTVIADAPFELIPEYTTTEEEVNVIHKKYY